MISKTINANQMRLINRSAILEFIRLHSPTSRTAIARELNVSMPTVMRIVDELFEEELLIEAGQTQKGVGRKRSLIAYNKEACLVIGIDLGGTKFYGALANIGGEILHEVSLQHHNTTGEESLALAANVITELLAQAGGVQSIRGIAVGAPGITRNQEGIVEWAPSLNWRDFPLKQRLEEQFHLPIFVDNDVNLAVLGEHWFGAGRDTQNMMLISIGTGVGAGLIIDGALYRGHTKASGEVGYLVPDIQALGKSYEGFGALESIVSGTGISERAAKREQAPGGMPVNAEAVFDAARKGDSWAQEIVEETIDYLALGIANINTLLDLELIVLSGGVARQSDLLIKGIYDRINGVIPRIPNIQVSQLGRRATVMGAIVLVVHATDNYYVVRTLS
ncbi:MAG: ROK family protein [Anaerolineae bacterium]|nr:ROK family protein [Anaerolineae bacterium]